jgi:acetolactate synthase regulatory subunit
VTQGKVVRVYGYYRDPGFLERVMGSLRKLWVDVEWIQARRVNDDGLYEVLMELKETKNTYLAILNLSKMVDVDRVEILEDAKVISHSFDNTGNPSQSDSNDGRVIIIYVPVFSKVTGYSWGESYSKDIR